jgi:hypothetical protein
MIDQLESNLRATLRERAAAVPAASVARLAHLDYHPRMRGLRPPAAIGALAGSAAAAGAVVALVSLGAGASNAFAGWTAAPTPPSPAQLAAARVDCMSRSPIAGLPLKLTDTRGPFTFSVYADRESTATCISGPSFTAVSGSISSAPANVPPGHLQLSTSHLTNRDGQAYSFAEGRTGTGVRDVTLILDNGTPVRATVANGWFVAWWPSGHEVKAADVTTPAGVKTQTFDLSHESPCGAKLCTGGAIGRGTNGPVTRQDGGSGTVVGASSSSSGTAAGRGGRVEGFSLSR